MNKIAVASDHAGFAMKCSVSGYLKAKGFEINDFGCYSDESCDYADFAHPLAYAVESGVAEIGIVFCGSGNGINMTVNKHQGIRSAICWNKELAFLARHHNDANVCSIPARFISQDEVLDVIDTFIKEPFDGGRHLNRIKKIQIPNSSL